MPTPVDMTAYAQMRASDLSPSIVQLRATITRRPSFEMPPAPPRAMAVGQTGDVPVDSTSPGDLELNLDLEVPALLRRNEG
jgi:hypothetical protein